MKRSDSLKRKKDFRYTYRAGRSVSDRMMALVFARNRMPVSRVGFSVSKKIGKSVQRNRVKRRMRESMTPLLPLLKKGYNIIFIAREGIVDAPFGSIGASMRTLLKKADLIAGEIR